MAEELNINLRVDHHTHFPSDPGHEEILSAIREMKELAMTLNETVVQLSADDTELAADVTALVNIINDIPARIQAAVVDALTKAGVSDSTITAALTNVDSTVQSAIAAAKAVLPAAPATGTDTITAPSTPVDTVMGGNGADTVTAGGGTDTTVGGQGNDMIDGGATGPLPPVDPATPPA